MKPHLVLLKPSGFVPTAVPTDEALVEACAAGDTDALGILFDRRADDVARFVGRVVSGNRDDVDDLVQMTFIETMRSARSFKGDSTARTWILAIAANVARNYIRSKVRRRRWLSFLAESPPTPVPSPSVLLERRQSQEQMSVFIAELKHDLREVFVLCDVEKIPGPEVSKMLGIKPGTLWRRLHEARQCLRQKLERA
ncbi:MAG: RNA polymerase sigma factor [Deltaproteobacteria bacterium]|nr:RNA polymerase sigma factor [Deltaproteobacteria bacterium]